VVFPLEILPVVGLGAALFHSLISLGVLLVAVLLINGGLMWTSVFFPLVILPLLIATLGIAWFLVSLGVFVRDVGQITSFLTMLLMFMSPVFYPVSALPAKFQFWLMLNPLTFVIEQSRAVIIFGKLPDWTGLGIYTIASLVVAWTGFWWFQKTRKGFADVL
jgi:lipopolysaccharide transport system permease protein